MKRFAPLGFLILVLAAALPRPLWGWGGEGHRIVAEAAVRSSTEPVASFYAAQMPFLLEHASDPDDWVVVDPEEARRHYLDLELLGEDPLVNLPATYQEARARYGPDTLGRAGTLPWTIVEFSRRLSRALAEGDWEASALLAAGLSHYVGDASMPLHTTVNYKGQLTGNLILTERTEHRHVHVRFEVAMVRQFRAQVRRRVLGRASGAQPVSDPLDPVRRVLRESRARIDPVLRADRELTGEFGGEFDTAFYRRFYQRTGDLAVEQLARASEATAALWLWAWRAAGSPGLPRERVAFGEMVKVTERGLRDGPRRRETKVFLHDGEPYVVVTADWPGAGRSRTGRRLSPEEYRRLWRELEEAEVWALEEALTATSAAGPTVTVRVARRGREHHLTVSAPEARPDPRYGRLYRAVRAVAPKTPAPKPAPAAAPGGGTPTGGGAQ